MENTHIEKYRVAFHTLVILVVISLPILLSPSYTNTGPIKLLIYRTVLLAPFYLLNVLLMVPKLLSKQQYYLYFGALLLSFLVALLISMQLDFLFRSDKIKHAQLVEVSPPRFTPGSIPIMLIFPFLFSFSIGTSFEMILNSEEQRREKEELKKEKLYSELSFLKSQINPHFLFNSLNNIYSLSQRNNKNASQAILLLSDLMRYILYDSGNGKIRLSQEINCLKNYIALQRLRISKKESVKISFEEFGKTSAIQIEPLILIPFLENAFKHGVSYHRPSLVSIVLKVEANIIQFEVYNTKKNQSSNSSDKINGQNGIGLSNAIRRLELCYPDRYELKIDDSQDFYKTNLTILV